MKLALCNEVLAPLDFAAQCALARTLGYEGLELAPYTVLTSGVWSLDSGSMQ